MASYTGPAQLSVAAVLQATESWAEPENEASLDRSRRSAQSCERHDTLDCCSWKTVKMGIKCYFCDFVSIYWLLPLNWYSTNLHTCIWVNTALIFFSILQLKGEILIKCTYSWSEIPNNKTRLRFIIYWPATPIPMHLRAQDHRWQSQKHELCMDNFYMHRWFSSAVRHNSSLNKVELLQRV